MTPKPPPWLVTHVSHGTLGDRACPLWGTQPPRQAAWHAPPAPLLVTCMAGCPQPGCTPLPQHSQPPPHPSTARHTWELGIFREGDAQTRYPGAGGVSKGSGGAKFPGQHSMRPRYRVPQAQLPLAHSGKARGKDVSFPCEDGPHGPQPFVGGKPLLGGGGDSQHGAWGGGNMEGVRICPPKQPLSPIP